RGWEVSRTREAERSCAGVGRSRDLACEKRHEVADQAALTRGDLGERFVNREPPAAIDLGERLPPSRARRPFHLERVAAPGVDVDDGLHGERVDGLAAAQALRRQRLKGTFDGRPGFFGELSTRGSERLLAGVELALRDRPRARILVLPE